MKSGIIAIVAGLTMIIASIALADVPGVINYQGRLTDPNGAPVADSSTNNLTFSIFESTNALTPLWAEAHPNVPVMNGLFSVLLGSVTNPLSPSFFSTNAGITRWLEVNVNGETLAPRKELVSVAYALQAGNAATLEGFQASQFAASSLTNEIIALQGSTNFLLNQTIILQSATNGLQAQAADLQAATGALNTAVGNLNVATGALQIAVGDLQTATNALQIQVGDLQAATNALSLATNALQAQLGVLATSAVTQAQDPMIISNGTMYLHYDTNDFVLAGQIQVRDVFVNAAGDVMMGDLQMFGGTVIQGVDIIDSVAIEDLTIANADIAANANIAASKIDVASIDHGQLAGLADDDHAQYLTPAEHTAINHDHGALGGLGDDDHGQYHNDTRGDARYAGNGWDGTTTLRTAQDHIANDGNMGEEAPTADVGDRGEPTRAEIEAWGDVNDWDADDHALAAHDHGALGGLGDDDHGQYHNDTRGDTRYAGAGWDGATRLVTAQNHIANDNNMGEEAPTADVGDRGEPTRAEIEAWGDVNDWDNDDHALVNHATLETDPQVADNLANNSVPRWDGNNNQLVGGTIVDNGSIGIGTDSPGARLDVRGDILIPGGNNLRSDSGYDGSLRFNAPGGANFFIDNDNNSINETFGVYHDNASHNPPLDTLFTINEAGTAYIKGNVGLGTPAPADKLEVNGNIRASLYADRDNTSFYLDPAGVSYLNDMRANVYYDRNNTGYYVDPAGSSKLLNLSVDGNLRLSPMFPSLYTGGSYLTIPYGLYVSGGTPYFQTQIQARGGIHDDYNSYLTIAGGINGYTYFSGNVGIGTANPGARLDIGGPAGPQYGTLAIKQSAGGQKGIWLQANQNNNSISLHHDGSWAYIGTDYTGSGSHTPLRLQATGGQLDVGSYDYHGPTTIFGPTLIGGPFGPLSDLTVRGDIFYYGEATDISDTRIKVDQRQLDYGLTNVMALNPIRYNEAEWGINPETKELIIYPERISKTNEIGLAAQEVKQVIPEAVSDPDETRQMWGLSYTKLVPVLIKAIQEQQALIEEQKGINTVQEAKIKSLEERVTALEQK